MTHASATPARVVLDTNVLLDYFEGQPQAVRNVRALIEGKSQLLISWMTVYELKVLFERRGFDSANAMAELRGAAEWVGWTDELVTRAVHARNHSDLRTADSIIYATALTQNAILYTRDSNFQNLPGVKLV